MNNYAELRKNPTCKLVSTSDREFLALMNGSTTKRLNYCAYDELLKSFYNSNVNQQQLEVIDCEGKKGLPPSTVNVRIKKLGLDDKIKAISCGTNLYIVKKQFLVEKGLESNKGYTDKLI